MMTIPKHEMLNLTCPVPFEQSMNVAGNEKFLLWKIFMEVLT